MDDQVLYDAEMREACAVQWLHFKAKADFSDAAPGGEEACYQLFKHAFVLGWVKGCQWLENWREKEAKDGNGG